MIAAVAIFLFLAALAFCGWGFWQSCKLMFRGFSGIFSQTAQASPETPAKAVSPSTRPGVPDWTDKLVADHIAKCSTCRASLVTYTLAELEPESVRRIVRICETEDKAVTP